MDHWLSVDKALDEFRRAGLTVEDRSERYFHFDLNCMGLLTVHPEPEKIVQLLEIARRYDQDAAFLNQVAERHKINDPKVYWHRSYHVHASDQPERWIHLGDWLREKGYDLGKI